MTFLSPSVPWTRAESVLHPSPRFIPRLGMPTITTLSVGSHGHPPPPNGWTSLTNGERHGHGQCATHGPKLITAPGPQGVTLFRHCETFIVLCNHKRWSYIFSFFPDAAHKASTQQNPTATESFWLLTSGFGYFSFCLNVMLYLGMATTQTPQK